MQTSREDRIALTQQHNQMVRQEKIAQSYRDDYYGHALNCDGDYRASRKERESGYNEFGEYWEE